MVAEQLLGNLTQGVVLGCVYGVATMGLSLIFGVLKVVNVGHGAFIMVGCFVTLFFFNSLGLSPFLAIPAAFLIGLGIGYAFYFTSIRRLLKAPELSTLLATFYMGVILQEVIKLVYGSEYRGFNWKMGSLGLGFTTLPLAKIYAALGSVAVALLLYAWFRKTRAGTAMRAVVEDDEGARVCGVNVNGVYALSFALGIGLTVASGVMLAMFLPVGINPYMGAEYTLKAFVIAVLGGLASPYGAFFGGLIFGIIENGSYTFLAAIPGLEPFSMTRFLAFAMLLIILLIRPTGLLRSK